MLTVSPELRSSAAIPTSADLPATIEFNCCSRVVRLGEEAAAAGGATNAKSNNKSALNRIALTRQRRHLPRRAARGDYHVIGDVRFSGERDRNHLLRLVVVERLKNELVEIVNINGSAAGFAGAVNGMFGQGVSWRTMAGRDGP